MKPLYEHDCEQCMFLGTFELKDLYVCPTNRSDKIISTVIARCSSEGSDYSSGLHFAVYHEVFKSSNSRALQEALKRALAKGFILPSEEHY